MVTEDGELRAPRGLPSLGDAAVESHKRFGRPLIPIAAGTKDRPLLKWVKEKDKLPATEPDILDFWRRTPEANYGVLLGGGLIVLDVDLHPGGGNGFHSLTELEKEGRTLPPTFTVRTPSGGGEHRYFRVKAGRSIPTLGSFMPGLDRKGEGGYVVGPGSIVQGTTYEVTNDVLIADAPEWLLDAGLNAGSRSRRPRSDRGRRDDRTDEWRDVLRFALTEIGHGKRISAAIPRLPALGQGERHTGLLSCLGFLRRHPWRDLDQWETVCDIVADTITFPSYRWEKGYRALVSDVWQMEPEPEEFDPFQYRDAAKRAAEEASVDRLTRFGSLVVFAPEYKEEDEISYAVDGIVPFGSVTTFAALFKTGKTELVSGMVRAITEGEPFLERQTKASMVLYLTEERPGTFKMKADRYGFEYSVGIVHRSVIAAEGWDWPETIDQATHFAVHEGYGVLIVDTFTRWSRLLDENNNAEITKRMDALERAAATGLAVVVVHQHGKGAPRGDGRDMRGASAFGDAVDVFCELYKDPKHLGPRQRRLNVQGRIQELKLIVEFDPQRGYQLVDDRTDSEDEGSPAPRDKYADIWMWLDAHDTVSVRDLMGTGKTKTTAGRLLEEMEAQGSLVREQGRSPTGRLIKVYRPTAPIVGDRASGPRSTT